MNTASTTVKNSGVKVETNAVQELLALEVQNAAAKSDGKLTLEKAPKAVKAAPSKTRSKNATKAAVTRKLGTFTKEEFKGDALGELKVEAKAKIEEVLNHHLEGVKKERVRKSLANRAKAAIDRLKAADTEERLEGIVKASVASLNAAMA